MNGQTYPSAEPEARIWSVGENLTVQTPFLCPSKTEILLPDAISYRQIVLSAEALAVTLSFGDTATELTHFS